LAWRTALLLYCESMIFCDCGRTTVGLLAEKRAYSMAFGRTCGQLAGLIFYAPVQSAL
jgi:hypothetical protein